MTEVTFKKTLPGTKDYKSFEQIVEQLYDKDSPRHVLGHEPSTQHLEGCYIALQNEKTVGRFAVYINPNLRYKGTLAACIGSYECIADMTISKQLIDKAKQIARSKGCSWLIGPMEGSTWQSYRFSNSPTEKPFFMEPYHHQYYNEQFEYAGLYPIAHYHSNLDSKIYTDETTIKQYESSFESKGIRVRSINMKNLENELYKIGQLSNKGFKDNFLFTPMPPSLFTKKYLSLQNHINPELICLLEQNEKIIAFVFAIEDYLDTTASTMIIKSVVKDPNVDLPELGRYLSAKINRIALDNQYNQTIHALMINDNVSKKISGNMSAKSYKTYSLYGNAL